MRDPARYRAWYEINRDRLIAKAEAWKAANPGKVREADARVRDRLRQPQICTTATIQSVMTTWGKNA